MLTPYAQLRLKTISANAAEFQEKFGLESKNTVNSYGMVLSCSIQHEVKLLSPFISVPTNDTTKSGGNENLTLSSSPETDDESSSSVSIVDLNSISSSDSSDYPTKKKKKTGY